MKYKAILFDLDGTLLPMDYDVFTKGYFRELAKKLSPIGLAPDALIAAVWAGTKGMMKNDGSRMNIDVFWDVFGQATGEDVKPFWEQSDAFYVNEFNNAKVYTNPVPEAVCAVRNAHATGAKVVLASNALFPRSGQITRFGWAGLKESDFDYIASYESERYAKPNPMYYTEICEKIGVAPGDCLMIGNDEREDMQAAEAAGLDGYMVTDCLIKCDDYEWKGPRGTLAELAEYLKTL